MIKSLDNNKASVPVGIPSKFAQMTANFTDCHLSDIITCDISKNKYCDHAETATVRQIFKKMIGQKIKNYWSVSLLCSLKYKKLSS